ncbi:MULTISPECIES: hypothetical protein [Streptomyces]|uniref:Transferase n=2 Tax=Streptomyces diastaticus group TaxID=2849069 RepID=A0ABQ1CN55_STRDI|nr:MULTISPECIES: hypothetical protein [Streptomyces]MBL3807465.1 hypothetical protein [Streptomyces sp. BRB081]PJM80477.1 hypothetical protein CH313_28125 [Streptomyces sp. TSRI0384-2]QNE80524.1 hypothetical protein F0345_04820 [Streptomyces rutgersensis]RPK81702.1 hypothetical protein EES47_26565 [Streptomyces sp. ADI98-12]GFH66513.1 hypothetical protein Srut_30270 [Streptomyces rutgersensis]
MTALLPRSAPGGGPRPADGPPRADCVADTAGGLTFDLPGLGGRATAGAALLLRPRERGTGAVPLPLTPVGGGRLRAALPRTVPLPEGHWDAWLRLPGTADRRLAPGAHHLGPLTAARAADAAAGRVVARLPYATRGGRLSLRSWLRAPHAEALELSAGPGRLTVTGRLYGAAVTAHAYGEIRAADHAGPACRVPVAPVPEPPHSLAEGTGFTLTLPHTDLAPEGHPRAWAVWLRPAGETGPEARLARLLGPGGVTAAPRPHRVFTLPGPRGPLRAAPVYTPTHDLTLRLTRAFPPPRRA